MAYKIILMMGCIMFSDISAMDNRELQEDVDTILQLMKNVSEKNSIVILNVDAKAIETKQFGVSDIGAKEKRRKQSQKILSDLALYGASAFLRRGDISVGEKVLAVANRIDTHEENPTCSQAMLRIKTREGIHKKGVCLNSFNPDKASFIIYNIPYCDQEITCHYDLAYKNFMDFVSKTTTPCVVLKHGDICSMSACVMHYKCDGKKTVFEYNQSNKALEKYVPFTHSCADNVAYAFFGVAVWNILLLLFVHSAS